MKKLILTGLVAAGVLLTTACSEDNTFQPQPGEGGNVTFTVQLPAEGLGSRAFADGLTADDLEYAVYDTESKTLIGDPETVRFGNALQTTVSLNLANGKSYSIAFFAHKKDQNVYTFNADTKTITVDYEAMSDHNDTDNDCFYNLYETGVVKGAINETVTLKRPVAQINWGTSDIEAATVVAEDMYGAGAGKLVSKVSVTNAYTTLDMFTGDVVEGKTVVVELPYLERPDNTKNVFPANTTDVTYEYISAHYLLAPKSSSAVIDLKLEIANDAAATTANSEVVVANAPYQANYRTNIYGALLTSPANYTVVKAPTFDGENNQPVDVTAPEQDDKGVYHVSTPEQLAFLAKNPSDWKDKTVVLDNDIDLMGMSWQPIGSNVDKDASTNKMNYFEGVFDGKNHTIRNFRCDAKGDYAVAGLFGALRGVVKNVIIENAYITSNHYAAALVAYSHNNNAGTYGEGKDYPATGYAIENCKVFNSTIITTPNKKADGSYDNGDKAGAILGYACSKMTVDKCEVRNNTIQAYRDLGGVIGYVAPTANIPVTIGYVASINNTLIQSYDYAYKENSKVYNHHDWIYGWRDSVEPTKLEGFNNSAVHSNNYFVMNMTPTNTDELYEALRYAGEGSVVTLVETTYELFEKAANILAMKTDGTGVNFTIKGAGVDKSIMKVSNYAFPKSNITFEDFTVELTPGGYTGFSSYLNGTFSNLKFKGGALWTWGTESTMYNNCVFDGTEAGDVYPVWIKLTADATFNDCSVKSNKGRAFLLCGDKDFNRIPKHNVTINNCDVETAEISKDEDKAVFEIHTEADAENITGTITLNNIKWDSAKFPGGLWREINNNEPNTVTDFYTIIVDGKTEQIGSR